MKKINPPDLNNAHVVPAMMTHTIPAINEIIDELQSLRSSFEEMSQKVAKLSVAAPPSEAPKKAVKKTTSRKPVARR